MNRRLFLEQTAVSAVGTFVSRSSRQTEHLILIVNGGGTRKKDYYEDESLSPNIRRLADGGFVFEEDHCERISSHHAAFAELLTGHQFLPYAPAARNIFDYLNSSHRIVPSLRFVPAIMETDKQFLGTGLQQRRGSDDSD